MEHAKIFYSSLFTRNEPPDDVNTRKTRNFWQIGFEIFNYPLFESSIEVIHTANEILNSAGLQNHIFRISDKRLFMGFTEQYEPDEQALIYSIMNSADDDINLFRNLYKQAGGKNTKIVKEIGDFIALMSRPNPSIKDLARHKNCSALYKAGLENLEAIIEALPEIKFQVLPFMAKSWDACCPLLFDARHPSLNAAICGGGNLQYNSYKPDAPKSGVGIGVTRIFEILKNSNLGHNKYKC